MGKIVERAEVYWDYRYGSAPTPQRDNFIGIFKLIESELGDLVERFDKELGERNSDIKDLEAGIHNLFEMLKRRTKRIEALEKKLGMLERELKMDAFLDVIPPEPMPPDVPYDRHNKPEGGLEPGDVISYPYSVGDKKFRMLGQFIEMQPGNEIRGGWHNFTESNKIYPDCEYGVAKDQVTFEFRPKHKES